MTRSKGANDRSKTSTSAAGIGQARRQPARIKAVADAAYLDIIDTLCGEEEVGPALTRALQVCRTATGADRALLLRETGDGGLILVAAAPADTALWQVPQNGWQPLMMLIARPERVDDLSRHGLAAALPDALGPCRSLLSAAVQSRYDGRTLVVLLAAEPARFAEDESALLHRGAKLMGLAIDRDDLASRANAMSRFLPISEPRPDLPSAEVDPSFAALSRAYDHASEWHSQIISVTDELLGTQSQDVDSAVTLALARTGKLAGVDRTYVFRLRPPNRLDNTHEWCADGIDPMIQELQDMPDDLLDEWRDRLVLGQPVLIPSIAELPDESVLREVLSMQGIKSLLAVPMRKSGALMGFVGYDAVRQHRAFLSLEVQLLKSVANAVGVVLDRAQAESAAEAARLRLLAENDRLTSIMAALPDLVIEVDEEGRYTSYNQGANLWQFMPPERFLNRMPEDVLPPYLARLQRDLMAATRASGAAEGPVYSIMVGGETRWHKASARMRIKQGQPDGFVMVIRDVTEQHRQQRQIAQLGKIAELTLNLVIVSDAQDRIQWVNPAFKQRSGWRLAEIEGKSLSTVLYGEVTDPATVRRIQEAMQQGQPVQAELMNRSRNGEDYWISADIQPMRDGQGKLEGFVTVQTDITDLQRTHQRALRDRILAMESSSDGIAMLTPDGRYSYMNRTYRSMFGIPVRQGAARCNWQDLCGNEGAGWFTTRTGPTLGANGIWRGELRGRRLDGSEFPQELSITRREDGGFLVIARDISEKMELEQERAHLRDELQTAQRRETIAHVAAGLAHDLNNIVAVVSGAASLLDEECAKHPELQVGVDRIKRATGIAKDLVAGLVNLGRRRLERRSQDLRLILAQGVELLGTARQAANAIVLDAPEGPQPVWADRTELLQVIMNLALNACEADPERPARVRIEILPVKGWRPTRSPDIGDWQSSGQYAVFRVIDTGAGIDPAAVHRLFEPNYTTKGKSGTGLGLPIVAAILRDNEAGLWFDSTPGAGTTVTVAWPVSEGDAAMTTVRTRQALPPDGEQVSLKGRSILVVDDAPDLADVMSGMLDAVGAVAVAVCDPDEARELLVANPGLWEVLVTDLNMPGTDGIALARVAAKMKPPVPVVLVTALPDAVGAQRNLFADVLGKPVERADLVAAVIAALG